jgi:hypothetical protein
MLDCECLLQVTEWWAKEVTGGLRAVCCTSFLLDSFPSVIVLSQTAINLDFCFTQVFFCPSS